MKTFPQVGKRAPNFVTVGVFKKRLGRIRLSDYRGKKYVMLLFYPANFTPVSPTELIALSDHVLETEINAIVTKMKTLGFMIFALSGSYIFFFYISMITLSDSMK